MKKVEVLVPDEKLEFFKQLLSEMNLTSINNSIQVNKPKPYMVDEETKKKAKQEREESLQSVLSKLEQMRSS